jgi:alkanesulfonate monooxygenase SsuD/methylene tetrahydromethanopterin reductase-like flavin-dependent oxidoreductase (luciferase family)
MRHGIIILPEKRWPDAAQQWRRAEEIGFDHAWTFDHLMWRWLRGSAWFSAIPILAAAAAVTSRIRLGTLVASPNLHHPVKLAKDMMTLDQVSGGRLVCGLGAGADGFDTEVFGAEPVRPGERAGRFGEFVELLDLLLRQEETSFHGRHYRAVAAHMHPGCVQRPRVPFAVAAGGPRGMRLAARYAATWVTTGVPGNFRPGRFDELTGPLKEQLDRLNEACLDQGRDPATLGRMVVAGIQLGGGLASRESFAEASRFFAELGFTDLVVVWPRPDFPFQARAEVLDEIAPVLHDARHGAP